MALIKCKECGKMISDTTERCIHCGASTKESKDDSIKEVKKEEVKKESGKTGILGFIFAILAAICGFVQLVKMSPTKIVLIYTLLFLATSVLLAIYCYPSKKKNSNLFLIALVTLLLGSVIRICQDRIGLEYIARYTLFGVSSIMLLYSTFKDKKQNNIVAFILLGVVAADAVYNFFALNNSLIRGYIWRLYLVVETLLPIALIFTEYTKENLNSGIKKVVDKLPNKFVMIGIVAVLAIVFVLLSIDNKHTSGSSNNGSGYNNGGFNVDEYNEDDDENENINTYDRVTIDSTTKKVTGEYSNEEIEAEISLEKVYVSDKVLPPKPRQSYYRYYDKNEGKKYLVAVLNVKNTGSKSLNTDSVFTNFLEDGCTLQAILDGKYEYSGFVVGIEKDSSKKYDLKSYYYLDALEKTQMYLIFEISSEVSNAPVRINACFGGTNLEINNSGN